MAEFKKVADAAKVPVGKSIEVECDGMSVALFNVGGAIYAIGGECTHARAPLAEGEVDGLVLTCPWHGATFDLATGKRLSAPAPDDVKCYKARIQGGSIEIEMP